jgi:hypothetical protein
MSFLFFVIGYVKMNVLELISKNGKQVSNRLQGALYRNGKLPVNLGLLQFEIDTESEPTTLKDKNVVFVNKEHRNAFRKLFSEKEYPTTSIALGGTLYDLEVYQLMDHGIENNRNKFIGVIYHEGEFDLVGDDPDLFVRLEQLCSLQLISLSTLNQLLYQPQSYTPSEAFLAAHVIDLLIEKDKSETYSLLTHSFANMVTLKSASDSKYRIIADHHWSDPCRLNLALDEDSFLLPVTEGASVDVQVLKKSVVNDHSVYERQSLSWLNADDVTKGLISEPSDHGFNESNTRTNDDIYNSYLNELIHASGYKEDIGKCEIIVCYNVDDRYHQAFEYKQLVGRLTVVKQGEVFKLKPNFATTDQPFTIEVYASADCWDSVRLVMPKEMKTHQVEKMFIDFFKLLDFDLQVSPGGVAGGGYTYRSFRLREQAHYRYKDWHIENGYVVLETA